MSVLDDIAAARARLAALVVRPRARAFGRYTGLPSRHVDAEEADAYSEAAREAFQAGPKLEGPRPRTSPSPRPRASMLGAAPRAALPSTAPPEFATVQEPSATAVEGPSATAVEEPSPTGRPARRQAGDTAPEFLLRTPTNVTPVVEDFFDGLIRRVEGDR